MKLNHVIMILALIAGAIIGPAKQLRAQAADTLLVKWANPDGTVNTDVLRNTIAADTTATGERVQNRVYKLQRGGFYWITETITNNGWPLRIVGEKPGTGKYDGPAVLQMVARADGTVNGRMITGGGDITLKNLYIIGSDDNGVQTYYQPIQIDASNSRFVFDNDIFERTNFALVAFTAKNNDIYFTNCKFRNLIGKPSTQQWEGRGISIWADQDTVVVENSTFFNVGFTALQIEGGSAKYVRFNHNTIVNLGRSINSGNWWQEAYFANNLIINGFWHGEGHADLTSPGRDPRATSSGMFSIGPLPSKYGPEEGRRVLFANNATWRDPAFATFYGDTIATQYFVNPVTTEDFLDKYDNMVAADTMWLSTRPDITTYPDTLVPDMIQNISDLRAGIIPAHPYFFDLPKNPDGTVCNVCPSWPLPENFSYTNAKLMTAGTDSLPLGDLNWFPNKKAEWEAHKSQYIAKLQAMAGPVKKYPVRGYVEAEDGTLGGDAAVKTAQGFAYYDMKSAGDLVWTFDLPAAGTYSLVVYTNMDGSSERGQFIYVNGTNLRNNSSYGEYHFGPGLPANDWTTVKITPSDLIEGADALNMPQGKNTIEIKKSWGWQAFSGVDVVDASGNTVISLKAPDAVNDGAIPHLEGSPWAPSGFKYVALNTNGSITWNVNPDSSGNYLLQVFYQAPNGTQTAQIQADGQTVVSDFELTSQAGDSTEHNLMSGKFALNAGPHVITLSGSKVNVDYIQLIQEIVMTGVSSHEFLPQKYALEQNYPNPFNPTTHINFSLAKASKAKLIIYNVLGQKVATLVDNYINAGSHTVRFNAQELSSGVYFYTLEAGKVKLTRKMLLLK